MLFFFVFRNRRAKIQNFPKMYKFFCRFVVSFVCGHHDINHELVIVFQQF